MSKKPLSSYMEVVGTMFCLYQARVVMCMCASGIYFASVSTLHVKSLELFQQCGNFSISFSVYNIECFKRQKHVCLHINQSWTKKYK